MFVTGANLTVPFFTIVLRKGYGLGAQAMAGGSFKAPLFTRRLADRRVRRHGPRGRGASSATATSSAAIDDPAEREALFDEMVARMYEHGKALNTATHFEIDDVIDPADSRTASSRPCAPRRPRRPAPARSARASTPGEIPLYWR